jgi:hypothetical protein
VVAMLCTSPGKPQVSIEDILAKLPTPPDELNIHHLDVIQSYATSGIAYAEEKKVIAS